MSPMTRVALRSLSRALLAVALLCAVACAESVKVALELANPVLLANQKTTTYLRLSMTGAEPADAEHRAPVNVAFVIDKSGSMQGEKLARAKDALRMAIGKLRDDDIVSVVAYDTNVSVLVPATKLSDRQQVYAAIARIEATGTTALFAGVSKGAAELRKFLDKERVNRIVLLSDGLANVGPSSPGDLAELGTSLGREGIAVTTIGLGLDYNEDLMTKLAQKSDGNHMFAENAADLERVFMREFGDVLTVAAQRVKATIHCAEGVRPVRVIGREADIIGQNVTFTLNQLYAGQTKYAILEVEVAERTDTPETTETQMANASVSCTVMATKANETAEPVALARFTSSQEEVEKRTNADVMVAAIYQLGVERNIMAMRLRDEGKIEEARQALFDNGLFLRSNAAKYKDKSMESVAAFNEFNASNVATPSWNLERKRMQEMQYNTINQQSSSVNAPGGGSK